ncbi:hypothetical protein GCM10027269_82280 [Kribbella endophytica]
MPSIKAQNPHSNARAIAVDSGQTMARIPNTMPIAPRTTSIFHPTDSQSLTAAGPGIRRPPRAGPDGPQPTAIVIPTAVPGQDTGR